MAKTYIAGSTPFTNSLDIQLTAPIDTRMVVDTASDLNKESTWTAEGGNIPFIYKGMTVVTADTFNIYVCIKESGDFTFDAPDTSTNWRYVGTTSGGVQEIQVIDSLTSSSTTDALSANQGKVLNASIQEVIADVSAIESSLGDYIPSASIGVNSGVVPLNATGQIDSQYLPSYVDDVIEAETSSGFPGTGESGKIYVATDSNLTYRWSGSAYVEIAKGLALGTTSSTAFAGDRGLALEAVADALPDTVTVFSSTSVATTATTMTINVSTFTKDSSNNYNAGSAATVVFSSATNTSAGLMSAADKAALDKAVSDITAIESSVGKLESSVGALNTSVGDLNTSVGALNTSVGALDASIEEVVADISTLQGTVDDISTNVNQIQSDISDMEEAIATIDSSYLTAVYLTTEVIEV